MGRPSEQDRPGLALAGRDLRSAPGQAVLLLLAITAATATLTLGLALHGVTSQPYQRTRAATHGPDLVAQLSGAPRRTGRGRRTLARRSWPRSGRWSRASGVTGHSGPYPLAAAVVRAHGLTAGVEVEGRGQAPAVARPARADGGQLGSRRRRGARADLRRGARRRRRRPDHPERPALPGRRHRGHRRPAAVPEPVLFARRRLLAPFPGTSAVTGAQLGPGTLGLAWVTQPDARALASL